ncbi:prepilin-type N-terminal cleavage/methylation domain-containing protein [Desulfobacterales bacterium HSG16]|nr:prepilin-type N-terminal cleavage/methylation domain-containing protein [Desulfobacterales bacterium HSG16]
MKFRYKNKGFTLVELLIVITLMGILVTPLLYMEIQYSKGFFANIYRQDMVEAGNRSLEWIAKDIRKAISVTKDRGENKLAGNSSKNRLVIETFDKSTIFYSFNKEKRVLTREEYSPQNPVGNPVLIELACYVDDFFISPVRARTADNKLAAFKAKIFHIRLDLSREVLNFTERITMNGVAAGRI